ncbi:hypothetical protein [Limnohabitans sp. JirII-31]|uniref:hypothetical protein n=1 Tax=Limnohabitans sp. JirII-31 TaxID=1977908 RepID=UPI000C1EC1C4|nr:hypothetical protein [Limnohabitans sp. JirII-31]PIT80632.1 hypothetical protein B9Z41_01545 [Limnohabitans sp. JirII-31]
MSHVFRRSNVSKHAGVTSIVGLLFLIAVVIFVLAQTHTMTGSKAVDSQIYDDSVAALYLAESGIERATYTVNDDVSYDDSSFVSSCGTVSNSPTYELGRGTFQFVKPSVDPTTLACAIRAKGSVGRANRTLESTMSMFSEIGTAGYGTNINMTLRNNKSVPAVAVFNLAWRRHGSTGSNPPGNNSAASACTLPSCGLMYSIESSSGTPSVGSLGTAVGAAANSSVVVTQTLNLERNYAEVGMIMPGMGAQPLIKGSFADGKRTANTQNNTVTTGDTSSGEAKGWCNDADTLVFGVSGRGNDNVTGAFASVVFNSNGSPAQPIAMNWIAHYPNTDGTTAGVYGDVFSEIWWTYNPTFPKMLASSAGTTVTVASTAKIQVGTIIKVYSGSGLLAGNTKVTSVLANGTQFVVSSTPTTPLTNATICGGVCALFNDPSSNGSKTEFALTRATAAAQQWAGGFTCLSGVDPSKVKRISHSGVTMYKWHEVISDEPIN